jgi:probable phosphoglycerate mutase
VTRRGRDFILRHGETVFNAAARLQGDHVHTPLTAAGFRQALDMGQALAAGRGHAGPLTAWSSPAGRALQTLALVCPPLGLDWHATRIDPRLVEIGMGHWGGRRYADVVAEVGPIVDPSTGLLRPAPDGESYADVAERLAGWLTATADDDGDRLVVMHGISSRVLRGIMTDAPRPGGYAVPVAAGLPQGSIVMIAQGVETVLHRGTGQGAV